MEAVQVREEGEYGCNRSGRQHQRKPEVEDQVWRAVDALRGSMDAVAYKHGVLA